MKVQLLRPRPSEKNKAIKGEKSMETDESIFNVFIKEICSNCKKNKTCQEELRIRINNTIKCYEYEMIDK